jgi:hypothetical protein
MGLRRSRGIVPDSQRLEERTTFGDADDVFAAAFAELDAHNYKNTWALLSEVLGQELITRWQATPGHSNSGVTDRAALLLKLYNCKQVDKWELDLLRAVLAHPKVYTLRQCDMLAAIIKVFIYHKPSPSIEATPAPPPAPLPSEAEVQAERERLDAEREAFLNRGDEIAKPHWQAHHRALAALGLCG